MTKKKRTGDRTKLCLRCGYVWEARVPEPRNCPHCKSPYWNRPKERFFKRRALQ